MSKKREREYTPEEAIALTLNEVTPHWYRSHPLLVGVDLQDRSYPQPLDPAIQSGIWVFFFCSSTSPVFVQVLARYRAWVKRFRSLGVQFIFGFRGHYAYFSERKAIEAWLKETDLSTIAVCDRNGALAKAFGAGGEPGVAILHDGKIHFSAAGPDWMIGAEASLHALLRESSPGLPLWPPFVPIPDQLQTTDRWFLRADAKAIENRSVELHGQWSIDEDRIFTRDPSAELHFQAPASSVSIVARSLSEEGDPTRIRFDSDGASFSDAFGGVDFSVDDEGNSCTLLGGPRAYAVLRNLPPRLRKLRFRFPFAKISAVGIYGLEFADVTTPTSVSP